MSRPWALGLTGSIGMGKSTTARMFRDEGLPLWDADAAVHRLYAQGGPAAGPVGQVFPGAIVDGAVSRPALKRLIAEDPSVLKKVEAIVHPLVAADRQAFLDGTDADIVVFDVPLLFETGSEGWFDSVLVVTAPLDVQKERVLSRPDMTDAHFVSFLNRQMPDAEKRKRADHVIETLTLEAAREDVRNLISDLRERIAHA
ncbi:dephospho-CoA kinase [Histidinibacterium aquaticum]|uniref:Dephospho-CoA kinase n=2 Tax=Histidinibacterium aquaticum TaxID=2613962 RepID=A0A5J5GG09_9RHOB|nr:dephospho-CoA kinase [Histidinibacterium aquaticum]KAA9007146.1 dephospho-CoA kinase [Histidinibacterium aquaticum]